ncbi:MAG: helix-turn-helix domain-containing protein [Pseudonocardiaceae bacterium]
MGDTFNGERVRRRSQDPSWRQRTAYRDLPAHLAAALRSARLSKGWSLRVPSRHTEASDQMISHLEAGHRRPSVSVAADLIAAYGLDAVTSQRLLSVARPLAGRSSPYRRGSVSRQRRAQFNGGQSSGRPSGDDLISGGRAL